MYLIVVMDLKIPETMNLAQTLGESQNRIGRFLVDWNQ